MKILPTLRKNLADERGSFSVEAILMFPLLVWAFMAMYVFFEGLRESNINLKATYTISDLLSRETDEINMNYLNGINEVYAWLSRSAIRRRPAATFRSQKSRSRTCSAPALEPASASST